jgi:uncharacterized protein (TIGR03085 family)
MGEPLDARERAALCDLFLEVGPGAPTLCEGWSTLDLAAHLVLRERDPRTPLVILGGERFAGLGRRLMDGARSRGYEALVERLRAGPPLVPWRVPGLRTLLNANEWFVHHEDVRRAVGRGPRTDPELDDFAWTTVRRLGPLMLRRARVRAALVAPGRGDVPARGGGPAVRVTGDPQELVLVLYGRRGTARVEVDGPPEAVDAFERGRFGI